MWLNLMEAVGSWVCGWGGMGWGVGGVGWGGVAMVTATGGRLNIKMLSYHYRHSHVKDKTVSSTVLSLTWESPYLGKMVFILGQGPGPLWGEERHGKL